MFFLGGGEADSKAQTITNYKCCSIKFENVARVFSSIRCGGSEFHSQMLADTEVTEPVQNARITGRIQNNGILRADSNQMWGGRWTGNREFIWSGLMFVPLEIVSGMNCVMYVLKSCYINRRL